MEMIPSSKGTKTKGVALLMSLSVILLLSVALMKTFENRTVETVHLSNSLQRFQAETYSRSVFRAILIAVRTKGLVFVQKNQTGWKGFPLPIDDGQYFQIEEIKPVDHLLNLNRRFRSSGAEPTIFLNIVNRIKGKDDPLYIEKEVDEIYPIVSAINDWIDTDAFQDEEFLYNNEEYYDEKPEFLVKNRAFDRLAEIKLLPPFRELGFSWQEIEENFRIFPGNQWIDINLATSEEMETFLEQFQGTPQYPNLYSYQSAIAGLLSTKDDELVEEEGEGGFLDPKPRFAPPITGRNSQWRTALSAEGVVLNENEHDFFNVITEHLSISFSVTVQRVTITTEALVKVTYMNPGKSLDIKGFEILSYKMR